MYSVQQEGPSLKRHILGILVHWKVEGPRQKSRRDEKNNVLGGAQELVHPGAPACRDYIRRSTRARGKTAGRSLPPADRYMAQNLCQGQFSARKRRLRRRSGRTPSGWTHAAKSFLTQLKADHAAESIDRPPAEAVGARTCLILRLPSDGLD